MSNNLVNKVLTVLILTLFICIAISPVINAINSKEKNLFSDSFERYSDKNDDLVEITIQFCKPNEVVDHTVLLTQEQVIELDNLIDNFKAKLDITETLEETITVYNDMVVSYDELGLIPDDMSIEEVQQLVTKGCQNLLDKDIYENLPKDNQVGSAEINNVFCLVSGETTNTFIGARSLVAVALPIIFLMSFDYIIPNIVETLSVFLLIWGLGHPLLLFNKLYIGLRVLEATQHEYYWTYHPANGWVQTNGLFGKQEISGEFWGKLPLLKLPLLFYNFYPAIFGFSGIRTAASYTPGSSYFGSAIWVRLDYTR